jgi:cbb3-type cytochrome c oxidase subunit I
VSQIAVARAEALAGPGPAPGSAVKLFLYSAVFWLLVADFIGLVASLQFINPQWSENVSYLTFGRLRPIHVNGVLFGWLSMAQVGAAFYMIPRLCGNRLWSESLGVWTGWLWNLAIVLGVVTLLGGYNQGREYAELVWPLDVGILVLILLSGLNVFMTVAKRREKKLYVTTWYVMGAFIWMPILYFVGNAMWETGNFWHQSGAIGGINDATLNWFYGHGVLGMWFTPMGVALAYYFIPILARAPLYSHALSLLGFWAIAFMYPMVGHHHLLQTPTPAWIKTLATLGSVGMLIPFLTVLTNLWMTMRGNWQKIYESVVLKFFITGTVFYLITAVQGSFQAMQGFNRLIHYTQWIVGHAHVALFGTYSIWLMGAIYYIVPMMLKRRLYSQGLAEIHFWMATGGFVLMMLSLQIAGLIQGAAWLQGTPVENLLPQLRPYFIVRSIGGAMMVTSGFIMAYNLFKTATVGEREETPTRAQAALAPEY